MADLRQQSLANMISTTVERLRQRNLTCVRVIEHDCCIPGLLHAFVQFDNDGTHLQKLCVRLRWDFELLCQIATEWEARNSSDASMFGFDSTIFFCEAVWGVETCRRSQWTSSIQLKYAEAFNQVYRDVRSCLHPKNTRGNGEDLFTTVHVFEAQSRNSITYQVSDNI
ncbi:hypothetical protein AYL99_05349 [Fonsecaea erecta]|uniref:Uncharacterized protein n=1 Tax=Fonsecaea erecta TaxID=1367422 RepID=A0A178ZKN3_9EURO|nr:hypothetical protein AYL99_05349 [Fonsecaea erecta]OAP60347.1 hypothetical protein AYL99_05349 [Fonsecaea erecta]